MKQKTFKFFISFTLVLALLLFAGVSCARNNEEGDVSNDDNSTVADPNAPVYTGMTVDEFNSSQSTLAANETNAVTNLSNVTQLTDAVPIVPDIYQDEDITITILFDNPKNFEILSFTINDVKYSSYMFEKGSTMSSIMIKTNVGNTFGHKEYTISAVKYVEGTEIKDVVMQGEQTIKINVYGLEKSETVNGLTYNFYSNKTAILTAVAQSAEEVIIPSNIGNYTVTAIQDDTFKAHYAWHVIVFIPKTIQNISTSQFLQGTESRTVYVLESAEPSYLGACLGHYNNISEDQLVKYNDCYYIISEQGASLIRYTGSSTDTYYVPDTITVSGNTVNVFEVTDSAFKKAVQTFQGSNLICEYVFNP